MEWCAYREQTSEWSSRSWPTPQDTKRYRKPQLRDPCSGRAEAPARSTHCRWPSWRRIPAAQAAGPPRSGHFAARTLGRLSDRISDTSSWRSPCASRRLLSPEGRQWARSLEWNEESAMGRGNPNHFIYKISSGRASFWGDAYAIRKWSRNVR